jgi:hypothetical protein
MQISYVEELGAKALVQVLMPVAVDIMVRRAGATKEGVRVDAGHTLGEQSVRFPDKAKGDAGELVVLQPAHIWLAGNMSSTACALNCTFKRSKGALLLTKAKGQLSTMGGHQEDFSFKINWTGSHLDLSCDGHLVPVY